ncbi:sigma-70 family RNA polymerase sigma factor [Sphingomonas sp. M1-B02]|uniref:sigma-70 family RNA polymerase sigma factor n=1 Tax=Sphingomonas sp. M1-B02 TaxID=3114300 RepID=UPI00223EB7B7|nr:RNA polymerase sigma factor FliA [Sphingomonas sp. S6-11]UZK65325.1 RNA polymerase sigma factor FliA [Sphingomonas sp. S6-11]
MASLAQSPLVYERVAPRDAEALVRKHLPLVRRIAWHVHGSMSSIVEVEDLIQIGMVALIEAVTAFEDRGQVTFEQYLVTRLRGSMIDELRRQATLTRGAMRRRRAYQETVAALAAELGHAPSDIEVAEKLDVTPEKLRAEYVTAEAVRFDSIDDLYSDESPWFMSDEPDAFDQLADSDQREALIAAITGLPEREAQVVQLYYVEELNLEEIGQVLGVGAARICQIKASAHARLKRALQRRMS